MRNCPALRLPPMSWKMSCVMLRSILLTSGFQMPATLGVLSAVLAQVLVLIDVRLERLRLLFGGERDAARSEGDEVHFRRVSSECRSGRCPNRRRRSCRRRTRSWRWCRSRRRRRSATGLLPRTPRSSWPRSRSTSGCMRRCTNTRCPWADCERPRPGLFGSPACWLRLNDEPAVDPGIDGVVRVAVAVRALQREPVIQRLRQRCQTAFHESPTLWFFMTMAAVT